MAPLVSGSGMVQLQPTLMHRGRDLGECAGRKVFRHRYRSTMRSVPPPHRPESGKAIGSAEVLLRRPRSGPSLEVADCLNDRVVRPVPRPSPSGEPVQRCAVERRVVFVQLLRAACVANAGIDLLSAITPGDLDIGRRDFHLVGVVRVMGSWDHSERFPRGN